MVTVRDVNLVPSTRVRKKLPDPG